MKTQEEILERIEKIKGEDFFGTQTSDLVMFLDFKNAKKYLVDSATKEEWDEREKETPKEKIVDYIPFAWGKANDCRGLSAIRSIEHFLTWLWLDESPIYPEVETMFKDEYYYYGKSILEKISEAYGIDWKALDDGERINNG